MKYRGYASTLPANFTDCMRTIPGRGTKENAVFLIIYKGRFV